MRPGETRRTHRHGIGSCLPYDGTAPRKRLRYWPLDIDIHNRRVAAPRENVHERWARYLRSLPLRHLATAEASAASERLWVRLVEEVEQLLPPNASPTDDGGILMSWTRDGRHLEIEVMPDASYEWFYRHRALDIAEGGVESEDSLRDGLIARLRQVIA